MRRKLTTIVAADMVGYSRLMREDEAAVLAALEILKSRFLYPKAEEHGGRIFRFLGDGTLLEFESALGAVEFSIDLQRDLAAYIAENPKQIPLVLRVGINLGDVVIDAGDLHGDGVTIASRVETLSEPGGICLTDIVHAQVRHKISARFLSMGPRSLKNIIDPIHLWRWRPSGDAARIATTTSLIDRSNTFRGQYIIDSKLVDLLLQLHARSVLLAVSNALDSVADESGDAIRFDTLYSHLGEELHIARQMLSGIKIERVGNQGELPSTSIQQNMSEFVAAAFSDSKIGYAFKIIPEAQAIATAGDPYPVKRRRLLDLIRRHHNDDFIARSRRLIDYAYID